MSLPTLSGLLLASLLLAALPPSSLRFSKASELRIERYDSRLQGAVDRALGGPAVAIVVKDVDSGEILAAKNLGLAGSVFEDDRQKKGKP